MNRFPKFAEYFNGLLKEKEPKALQEEVARKLGITQGALSKIKNGMMVPSEELALRIAEVWQIDNFAEMVADARQEDVMKAMQRPGQRVDELMSALGLSQSEFASRIGVGPNAITNWKSRGIQGSSYEKIATAFPQVNMDWLKNGNGEMFVSQEEPVTNTRPHIPTMVTAGSLVGFSDAVKAGDCEMRPVISAFPEYDYTMTVKGNSMEPKFETGDTIAIRKVHSNIEWGHVYVIDTADGAIVKRLYDEDRCYRCVSYNKEYPDMLIEKDQVFGVYKVVGLIRL